MIVETNENVWNTGRLHYLSGDDNGNIEVVSSFTTILFVYI